MLRNLRGLSMVLVALALIKLVVMAVFSGRYGWHRDELYNMASGNHLAWGYVDIAPLTPFLARLDEAVFGISLVGLRLLPELAGAIIVVLAGLLARELGGGRPAQVLAALLTLICPMLLGFNWLFQTITFEQLWVVLALLLVARLLRTGDLRLWVPVGIVLGIGLETKYTVLDVGAALALGLLLTRARRQLATPWPWLGLVAAALVALPNVVWQVQHGWPTLDYLRNQQAINRFDYPPIIFALHQVLLIGPLIFPIAVLGGWFLFRRAQYRPLGWACAAILVTLFVLGGKPYYVGPIYPLLLAAGAVQIEGALARPGWRIAIATAAVLQTALLLPISLPVLPATTMHDYGLFQVRTDYADEYGWDEYVAQVNAAWQQVPPEDRAHAVILASNYGEAGAVDDLSTLPRAYSGRLNYWYWGPPEDAQVVVAVGYSPEFLQSVFGDVTRVGTVTNQLGVRNQEYGRGIYICRSPHEPLTTVWPRFKALK